MEWLLPAWETFSGPGTQIFAHGGAMGKSWLRCVFRFCDTVLSVTGFQFKKSWFGEEHLILSNLDPQH